MCCLEYTEPQGFDGLLTIMHFVFSSINDSMCLRSASHSLAGWMNDTNIFKYDVYIENKTCFKTLGVNDLYVAISLFSWLGKRDKYFVNVQYTTLAD